jgi:hypothetical protein
VDLGVLRGPERGSGVNVFEWCWEHGPDDPGDREVLMRLAFRAVGAPPSLHPLSLDGPDPDVVGRLVTGGFLSFGEHESCGVWFPAYEEWMRERVVVW